MTTSSIIQEIHKIRDEYSKRFGDDLKAICDDARKKQGRDGRLVVLAHPKPTLASKAGNDAKKPV